MQQATQALNEVQGKITSFVKEAVKGFAEATVGAEGLSQVLKHITIPEMAIASFTALGGAMASLLPMLANQQIQLQMLARQMWTTQNQATAFSFSLKALGANLQELYLSPTLMKQYQQLHAAALQMQTPSDYSQQIGSIQNISVALAQMRLEAYYALQWIGYYFTKYMAGPIARVTSILNSINAVIIKNMPTWTKRVATVMVAFMTAGDQIVQALGSVWNWLKKIGDSMPGWSKGIAAAIGAIGIASLMNPVGLIITAMISLFLLFNDLETYLHGGKSALGGFWKEAINLFHAFVKLKGVQQFFAGWKLVFYDLKNIVSGIVSWVISAFKTMANNGTLMNVVASVIALGQAVFDLVKAFVIGVGDLLYLLTNGPMKQVWTTIGSILTQTLSAILNFFSFVRDIVSAIIEFIVGNNQKATGDLSAAWSALGGFFTSLFSALQQEAQGLYNAFVTIFSPLGTFFISLWNGILLTFQNSVNSAITQINDLISLIDLIPGVHISKLGALNLVSTTPTTTSKVPSYVTHNTSSHSKATNIHIHAPITVHGASDAHQTGAVVAHHFNRTLHNVRGVVK